MSIIDRILGRTPTEGPQIHAPGKAAPQAGCADHRTSGRARGGAGPGAGTHPASEGHDPRLRPVWPRP